MSAKTDTNDKPTTAANQLLKDATLNSIRSGPQVGERYMFRTLSLYFIGTVIGGDAEWIILAPGSVEVVLSVGDDMDAVYKRGVVESRRTPVWSQLRREAVLEFAPISLAI